MKKLLVLPILFLGCNGLNKDKMTDEEKAFYTFGFISGEGLASFNLSDADMKNFMRGYNDAVAKKDYPLDDRQKYQTTLQEIFQKRFEEAAKKAEAESATFMEKFLQEEGAKKTASGLGYKIVEPGNSKRATDKSTVEAHYVGTLMSGKVFDSSKDRGAPAKFMLEQVIPGWREGIKLIGEGGKIKLVVPADLAYGKSGAMRAGIDGGATILFDVELIKILDDNTKAASGTKAAKNKKAKK